MSAGIESILPSWSESAIECRGVCLSYGKLNVLSNLALTVPQGHIYGLLGPSGCGKTTLLRCIVGRLRISKGRITVLGKPPAFPGHGVPGRMVGYMPQDLALYDEFTISDTFWFFGRIHGLTSKETESRISFLIEFLDLPEKSKLVRNLSGGQRRRVSLGAALLQNPQLLILDEPTVGVDPVLRSRIWHHLLEIVKNGQVSVIITTHYIEEARQANVVFVNQSKAIAGVEDGQYWGIIGFGANFSKYLLLRIMEKQVTEQIVDGGSVHVWLDMTNQQIAFTLQLKLQEAFEGFVKDVLGIQSYLASLPVKFEVPVYGSKNPDFTTFIAPGAIVSITFFLAVGLTALSFVMERKQGLLDRCWVAGVSSLETMLAHLFSQLFTMAVQITLLLIFVFLVFKIPNEGSLVLIVILIFLQGVTGISMGLVLSSAIDDEQSANQASLGIFFPNLIISGIIWPIECIPYPLRYLSMALPQTYAAEALRCIMSRGWGLTHVMVWRGFAVTLAWNTFFLILATVILKIRR